MCLCVFVYNLFLYTLYLAIVSNAFPFHIQIAYEYAARNTHKWQLRTLCANIEEEYKSWSSKKNVQTYEWTNERKNIWNMLNCYWNNKSFETDVAYTFWEEEKDEKIHTRTHTHIDEIAVYVRQLCSIWTIFRLYEFNAKLII